MAASEIPVTDLTVSFRVKLGSREEGYVRLAPVDLGKIDLKLLQQARQPGCHKEQLHIPGWEWISHQDDLVWYESRLEMMTLRGLEQQLSVRFVISQPFRLHFKIGKREHEHYPDFLVLHDGSRPLIVNVKPNRNMALERSKRSFAACEELCRILNWDCSVRSEPTPEATANIRWLNGYRRKPFRFEEFAPGLLTAAQHGCSVGEALEQFDLDALARPALFHLLWSRAIRFDRDAVLSDASKLFRDPM